MAFGVDSGNGYNGSSIDKRIRDLEYQKTIAKERCSQTDENKDSTYNSYKFTQNIFDNNGYEKDSLQRKLEKLQEERQAAVNKAIEDAEAAGNSTPDDIERIKIEVYSNFQGDISQVISAMTKSAQSLNFSQTNYMDAESAYRNARSDDIAAGNYFMQTCNELTSAYLDKHKLLQTASVFNIISQQLNNQDPGMMA